MKFRIIFILLFNIYCININAINDTLKERSIFLLLTASYNVGIGEAKWYSFEKYSSEYQGNYEYERLPFYFKTPTIGIGYVRIRRGFFIKHDLAYFFAIKKIDAKYNGTGENINDHVKSDYMNPRRVCCSSSGYGMGSTFYRFKDEVKVKLNSHYLEWNLLTGIKAYKDWNILLGLKANAVLNYYFKGSVTREASKSVITGYISPSERKDSVIEKNTIVFTNKKEIKGLIDQSVSGNFYWNFGINYELNVLKKLYLIDLLFDFNSPFRNSYKRRNYVSLKISYCL